MHAISRRHFSTTVGFDVYTIHMPWFDRAVQLVQFKCFKVAHYIIELVACTVYIPLNILKNLLSISYVNIIASASVAGSLFRVSCDFFSALFEEHVADDVVGGVSWAMIALYNCFYFNNQLNDRRTVLVCHKSFRHCSVRLSIRNVRMSCNSVLSSNQNIVPLLVQ